MPIYKTPITAVPDANLPASAWNEGVRDSLEALAKPPRCKAYRNAALSLNNATLVNISWDTELYDTDNFRDPATPSRLTIPRAGVYEVKAIIYYGIASGGIYRVCAINRTPISGGPAISERYVTNRNGTHVGVEANAEFEAAAGDFVEVVGYQDSGAALALSVGRGSVDVAIRWVNAL